MTPIVLVKEPTIILLAEMHFLPDSLRQVYNQIAKTHPECFPEEFLTRNRYNDERGQRVLDIMSCLFPHSGQEGARNLSDNELLPELMGRLCYQAFGAKAGTPTNKAYIQNTQRPPLPHRSLMYHPKMSFFISGVSRRLSHELIRHYVGADREEEGSPSQESTRYVEHPGWFVVHPYVLVSEEKTRMYELAMEEAYGNYLEFVQYETGQLGHRAVGMEKKRIYEAASSYLPHSAMTSLGWTTNPAALQKLFAERTDESADLEFQRLARKWQALCKEQWPNLFLDYTNGE